MSRLLMLAALCCMVMITCPAVGSVTLQAEGDACYAMAEAIPGLKTLAVQSADKTVWTSKPTTSQDPPSWCSFQGVTCGNMNGSSTYARVLSIGLADLQLTGTLPSIIGNFLHITTFDILMNKISGTIPSSTGFLTSLKRLVLTSNLLRGTIPSSITALTNLEYLGMINNNLIGTIPHSVGNFGSLKFLGLGSNLLNGTIPDTFSALKNLEVLDLHSNSLKGIIPSFVSNLQNLAVVDLNSNSLIGKIPDTFGACTMLKVLYLYSNSLTGVIPSSLGYLTAVTILDLGLNLLRGTIPSSIGNLNGLTTFDLGSNSLTGTIPQTLASFKNLTRLVLYGNLLSGTVSDYFGTMKRLKYVDISRNSLGGEFPKQLLKCTQLEYLDLSVNKIVGSIPSDINALSSLETLKLRSNRLNGTIPSTLSSLVNLNSLDLYSNFLTMGGAATVPVSTFPSAVLNGNFFNISENCLVFVHKLISVKATHCGKSLNPQPDSDPTKNPSPFNTGAPVPPVSESTPKPSAMPSANPVVVTVRVIQDFTSTARPIDLLLNGSHSQVLFEDALSSVVDWALGSKANDQVVLISLTSSSIGRRTYLTEGRFKADFLVSVTDGINAEELKIKISNFTALGHYTRFMAVPFPTSSITANGLPSVTTVSPSMAAPESNVGKKSLYDSYTYLGFLAFSAPIGIIIAIVCGCISCRRRRGDKSLSSSDYPDSTETDGLRNAVRV